MAASSSSFVSVSPGYFRLVGTIELNEIKRLSAEAVLLWRELARNGLDQVEIDLSGVESANSATLALLLECAELARERSIRLTYRELPEALTRLATVSNLLPLLEN
ncbi:STAS domain-containing protein [Chromatium okenii]|uniref:STAS domain-containing protein n=1 Tax=Chromatium okenii TaxID=61644 RepID=UPI001F5B48A4|nr:STAS domain-containing protein [Chromatium okenii]